MIAEAMRVGLPEVKGLFAEPEGASAADVDESGARSKPQRGKAQGVVLGLVRSSLSSRYAEHGPRAENVDGDIILLRRALLAFFFFLVRAP